MHTWGLQNFLWTNKQDTKKTLHKIKSGCLLFKLWIILSSCSFPFPWTSSGTFNNLKQNRFVCHEFNESNDMTNEASLSMWRPLSSAWLYVMWHQNMGCGSDQRLVDSKESGGGDQLAAALPFQDFMEITVTSEGSQSRQQRAARKAAPQNILEGVKYHVGTKQHSQTTRKKSSFVCLLLPCL